MASGEDAIIAAILAHVPHRPSPVGPGDDAACLAPTEARVITTDLLVENTHFVAAHPPFDLGWKSLVVNLSDVAAMGAVPSAFTLGLGLPATWSESDRSAWLKTFAGGLGACANAYGVVVAGGDTVRAGAGIVIAITAWGTTSGAERAPLTRAGARPGDVLMVCGAIGRSGLGLRRWLSAVAEGRSETVLDDPMVRAHLRPEPPLGEGPWAQAHGATAAMDVSDGLATDLPRLARASGIRIRIDLADLPDDPAQVAHAGEAPWMPADRAAAGEDYGLLVAVPPTAEALFEARGFARIATALEAATAGVDWFDHGIPIPAPSHAFQHFADELR
jgi:thiamine-monophosphate kinase